MPIPSFTGEINNLDKILHTNQNVKYTETNLNISETFSSNNYMEVDSSKNNILNTPKTIQKSSCSEDASDILNKQESLQEPELSIPESPKTTERIEYNFSELIHRNPNFLQKNGIGDRKNIKFNWEMKEPLGEDLNSLQVPNKKERRKSLTNRPFVLGDRFTESVCSSLQTQQLAKATNTTKKSKRSLLHPQNSFFEKNTSLISNINSKY